MNIRASAGILGQAAKNLNFEWDETKNYWRDLKAQDFERAYLSEVSGQVARTIAIFEEIDLLLRKVRKDCE